MFLKKYIAFVESQESLSERLFWGVLSFSILTAVISTIFTSVNMLSVKAIVATAATTVLFALIAVVAKCTKRIAPCYFVMCLLTNVVLLPINFFVCGGFHSGMILYCFMGLFLCTLLNHARARFALVLVSMLSFEVTYFLAWVYPEMVIPLDEDTSRIDVMLSFVVLGVILYVVIAFILAVNAKERRKRDILIKKLEYYSKRDPLTSLFNRRYFIRYLDKMIWPERKGFYMLMYDIDSFKHVNDTYGHPFGDVVLCEVANVALGLKRVSFGECAVRYGGEEFIQLFYANSFEEAYARAEQIRKAVSSLRFEEHPEVHVTISGGFIECSDSMYGHQNQMLSHVDSLLYKAKQNGKNQICVKE